MSFRKNVLAMLSGTVLAQAIPLLVMPLLTRLYSPEAIGLQTLFMGSTAALGVAATCRFDLAVVLPERDEDAYQLGALVLLIGTFTAMLASLAIWFFGPLIAEQTGYPGLTAWLGLLPVMMLGTMLTLLGTAYASRERSFTQVAKANVANQALYAVVALLVGYIGASTQGLVVAKVLGQWTSVLVIMLACGYGVYRSVRDFDYREIQRLAKRYRQFLYFNTPYSFIGTVARDMPIFLFSPRCDIGCRILRTDAYRPASPYAACLCLAKPGVLPRGGCIQGHTSPAVHYVRASQADVARWRTAIRFLHRLG
ncbi:oligosaccharide flippase family protein [Achromobacter xylosoxidans]